jgi:uncharacterized protein YjgD (DUF1641 family)
MASSDTGAMLKRHPAAQLDPREELALLHAKLDTLGAQVQHLYQQAVALDELKRELVPLVRDGIGALGAELQTVEHEFNSQEILQLARKLLHNTPTLIRLLDRLESLDGLVGEVEPLGRHVVRDLIERLEQFEQRGYFRMLSGLAQLFERVAEHATQEDLDRLTDNIVPLVETLKRATQPQMVETVNRALSALEASQRNAVPRVGWWGLLRTLREPALQQGLGLLVETLRQVSAQAPAAAAAARPQPPIEHNQE